MQFNVRALSSGHVISQIHIDAMDEADARRQLAARGLYATAMTATHKRLSPSDTDSAGITPTALGGTGFRSRNFSLILFSQELLALLTAGLSIVESLEALEQKETSSGTRTMLQRLLTGLRDGQRFSDVLSQQPELFSVLYVGMIKAAEGSSDLPRSLTRFIDYQQRIDIVRNNIISAAIYPLILLCVGGAVALFLCGYVVPRFAQVYRGTGRSLPWMSQVLLDWGQFAATHTTALLTCLCCGCAALILSLRHFHRSGKLVQWAYRIPAIGERLRIVELARLYLTLGMLLEGGMTLVTAISTVQAMVSAHIRLHLQQASTTIQSGMPLSLAFDIHQLTTPISLRLLRVGERSGELGAMLNQSAAFYDGEISRWIDRFSRIFEPALMAVIGIVIGTIVILLYMPIFDLAGSLS